MTGPYEYIAYEFVLSSPAVSRMSGSSKNESKSPLTGWRHELLRHCSWCATRRHINPVPVYSQSEYVPKTSIDSMKDNVFKLAKERIRIYPAQTIMDADYADDIALLANTPVQAETLHWRLERAEGGISLHVNAYKTEYMCFNERGDISTLKGGPL